MRPNIAERRRFLRRVGAALACLLWVVGFEAGPNLHIWFHDALGHHHHHGDGVASHRPLASSQHAAAHDHDHGHDHAHDSAAHEDDAREHRHAHDSAAHDDAHEHDHAHDSAAHEDDAHEHDHAHDSAHEHDAHEHDHAHGLAHEHEHASPPHGHHAHEHGAAAHHDAHAAVEIERAAHHRPHPESGEHAHAQHLGPLAGELRRVGTQRAEASCAGSTSHGAHALAHRGLLILATPSPWPPISSAPFVGAAYRSLATPAPRRGQPRHTRARGPPTAA